MLTVEDLIKRGDKLFGDRAGLDTLWQEMAEHFYPERAEFTSTRWLGEEFADELASSEPIQIRRDLANSFAGLLRRDQWFKMTVEQEDLVDTAGQQWLEWATHRMDQYMKDRAAKFSRATKGADHDFVTFGNCVITPEVSPEGSSLLYRNWHLRDIAWSEDQSGDICEVHRKWEPTIAQLIQKYGEDGVHRQVANHKAKDPFKKIQCRHVVMRAEDYGYEEKRRRPSREVKYVSLYFDVENKHKLGEEQFIVYMPYVLPRWNLLAGSQYGFSPCTMSAIPDARSFQAVILTILEAGEKFVNPPLIGVVEAMRSDADIRAGGITAVDAAYDERMGDVLRPLDQDRSGIPIGFEVAQEIREAMRSAFFLDQIDLPPIDSKAMTAYEFGERMKQFTRKVLPLFEPVEDEYSAPICEATFDLLWREGALGTVEDVPESIRFQQVDFKFMSPLREAAEKARMGQLGEMIQILEATLPFDPALRAHANLDAAVRSTLEAVAEAEWINEEDMAAEAEWINEEDMAAEVKEQLEQQAQMQQMAEMAQQGGMAAESMGKGMREMNDAAQSESA